MPEEEARAHLAALPHFYYEENMLHGMLIERFYHGDISGALQKTEEFLPYIDNWAVCDCTAAGLKVFSRFPKETLAKIHQWLASGRTYSVRFGVVTLLNYFMGTEFDKDAALRLCAIEGGDYYVDMAVAWYFATALARQYDAVIGIFKEKKLPRWTHNKSIQKAKESFRVPEERKIFLDTLKY
jgi:3-methyladenine DNA glycosylase AlkD